MPPPKKPTPTSKRFHSKGPNDEEGSKPPITTKTGSLRYKEAARQVREIEKSNKILSTKCHLGISEVLEKQRKPPIQPAILEIRGPTSSQLPKREKCTDMSRSTITSSKTETFLRQKPWKQIPCTELKVLESSSSLTPTVRGPASFSDRSNYQGWINTVPICLKSEDTTSAGDLELAKAAAALAKSKKGEKSKTATIKQIDSMEMDDTEHEPSEKPMKFTGPAWQKPCRASVIAGAPQRYIGTCTPSFEQISKMSKTRQKFFLTQDPRKTHCLVNPDFLRSKTISEKKEFNTFTKMVKIAENECTGKEVEKAESIICETLDPENPLNLDFQGLDYKNTYEGDEQDFQNLRLYRRLCRHLDRKRAKVETQEKVEEELQNERLAVPARFAIQDRNAITFAPSEESIQFGKLYRSTDKPSNKQRIQDELQNRRKRYKELYLKNKQRRENEAQEKDEGDQAAEELLGATVAQKNFDEAVERIDDAIKLAVKGEEMQKRQEVTRRRYPHTIRETRVFKQKLKVENRVKHDRAFVKQEFYKERLNKEKNYPELQLEVDDENQECEVDIKEESQSESSDDEDNIDVGKQGSQFMLRGFHFKLGENLRGKIHQREKDMGPRKEKGCISREQWLNELAPKKRQVKLDVEVGIIKLRNPDDPEYELFPPERGLLKPKIKKSAVKEFVQQRLGRHYDRSIRSKLKTKMPRLPYHVKKFNLIRFLYSENDRRLEALRAEEGDKDVSNVKPLTSTMEYISERDKKKQEQKEIRKRERMALLGIPCIEPEIKTSQITCEPSDSETDSDWLPEREPDVEGNLADYEERMAAGRTFEKLTNDMVGNMPAPEYREGTLRRHPRHPRDYDRLRVPSQQFHQAVKTSGLPHMRKLEPDVRLYENVRLPKRPYTQKFEARHHHDHWNPIQTTMIDVHYQPKIINAEITKEHLSKKEEKALKDSFEKAHPACMDHINEDLTCVKYNFDEIIAQHREEQKKTGVDRSKDLIADTCQLKEFRYHSRDPKELEDVEYPGRQEYLEFLEEIRTTLEEKKKAVEEEGEQQLCIDKNAYIEELEADLKSIESCLTSVSSSLCTNLTNDSGSFLLMEGVTKVPLDYIRKSVVPFEELQRSRFKAVPIDCDKEEANPFRVLPFSGQKRAQIAMTAAKDSFFTFTSRLRNGMRLRLETPIIDVRKMLIGRGKHKYPGAVTTDIDENYVTELKNRPSVKYFPFITGRNFIKNALRLQFEAMIIQGQIVRAKIYDRLNELHWQAMQKTKTLYEKLFAKWEKKEYETAMSVVYKVKTFYEITDTLRSEFRELDRQQTILNMDIVFIEGIWIRRVMLQNFHYLLGDREWRYENDWIHRIPKEKPPGDSSGDSEKVRYELEGFAESIANRSKVNVRNREKDDAWAIKAYYEDVYLPNRQPILIVFPDADSFLNGIENLKLKTFMLLLELHFTMSVHTELQGRLETFEEWCMQELKEKEEYVMRKCSKKYFMEDRADELRRRTLDYLDEPIENSYNDPSFNRDRAVISEVWRNIVPATQRGAGNQDIDPCDMVAMMSDVVVNLIAAFETIPIEESRRIETQLRRRRAYLRKLSKYAYQTEYRIDLEMRKVKRNLEPPYQKPKKVGKLKRTYLKKKVIPEVIPEVHISEHTKFFFRAFHDEGDVMQVGDARDSIMDVNNMQDQIVPFYFDHFLKLNGYSVNYNFKTQVEMRDGSEIDRFQVKSLIPEVVEKIERWENLRKKTMDENIARNPKMYENVNF